MKKEDVRVRLNNWRGSPRKFVKYLRSIQKGNAVKVAEQLRFLCSPYAEALRKLLISGIANASNVVDDVNKLIVAEASVGRGVFLKRVCFRGRGRMGRVTRPGSNLNIVLREDK